MNPILSSFISILLVLIFHEFGHAIAAIRNGIKVREIGIGIPIKYLTLRMVFRLPFFYKRRIIFSLSPLILIAFVRFSDRESKKIEMLPIRGQIAIHKGGIMANLYLCFVILACYMLFYFFIASWPARLQFLYMTGYVVAGFFCTILMIQILIFSWRKIPIFISHTFFLALFAYFIFRDNETVGSVVAFPKIAKEEVKNFETFMIFTAALSAGIAIINLLPFSILDGGRIAHLVGRKIARWKWEKSYLRVLDFSFIALMVYIIIRDIVLLF